MKKIFNIMVLSACMMSFPACHYEIDDVFDQPSAIRVQEEMERVDGILKGAENGWIMEYYADLKYGGYNIICRFNEDNTVTAQSEIHGELTATSHFKFEQSQGVVLSFDEYNEVIHFFSNPANIAGIGYDGDGMLGDFEFRVMSANEEEVVLSGKKHGSRIIMKPLAGDVDWSSYLIKVLELDAETLASTYKFTFGDKAVNAYLSFRQLTFVNPETNKTVNVPYIITDEGYRLYSELTFNGKTVNELVYSAADGKLYAPGDNTVSLEAIITPLSETVQVGPWFVSQEGMSASTLAVFMASQEICTLGLGVPIVYMVLGTGDWWDPSYNTGWGLVTQVGNQYLGQNYFKPTIVDEDTISLEYTGSDNMGSQYIDVLYFGGIVECLNSTFDLTTDNPKLPSWIKLQDTRNPDNHITLYANEILLPFGM